MFFFLYALFAFFFYNKYMLFFFYFYYKSNENEISIPLKKMKNQSKLVNFFDEFGIVVKLLNCLKKKTELRSFHFLKINENLHYYDFTLNK